ncbi:MAG: RraA family protein [Pseudomonadota bacterium]
MAIDFGPRPANLLDEAALAPWREIPSSIIGDEVNRTGMLAAAIRPLHKAMGCVGQALTVDCMVGDNAALHYALTALWPSAVIVADGRGHEDTAIWGGILHSCAQRQGAGGVILDGAMRDSAEVAGSGLAAYCRAICARGPHKGWGGAINRPIQCGGVAISPGDLIVADQDGIAVVRPDQMDGLLERCRARLAKEEEILGRIAAGELTVDIMGFPPAEKIGR